MNATVSPEYLKLERDSSNDIIRHDARRGDRKYPEAAVHARNAGLARLGMGEIMFDAGDFPQAAADWLSASACFYLASDVERMREALDRARHLDREGKIPPERRDIHEAMKEREEQLRELERKMKALWLDYRRMVGSTGAAILEALDFLRKQVRELPGYPHLHVRIADQAMKLGQRQLAVEAMDWARKFDPSSPHLAALQASHLFTLGDTARAAELAREVLTAHPDMDPVRFLLAQALAFRAGPNAADWKAADYEAAIEVLQPLLEKEPADPVIKLLALALAALVHHGLGQNAEHLRQLTAFNNLAEAHPALTGVAIQIRQSTPHVFLQPGTNGPTASVAPDRRPAALPDHGVFDRVFKEHNPMVGVVG